MQLSYGYGGGSVGGFPQGRESRKRASAWAFWRSLDLVGWVAFLSLRPSQDEFLVREQLTVRPGVSSFVWAGSDKSEGRVHGHEISKVGAGRGTPSDEGVGEAWAGFENRRAARFRGSASTGAALGTDSAPSRAVRDAHENTRVQR